MKPRTKLQKKIVKLSEELPDLNSDQKRYAREELFEHKATLLKSGKLSCLDCGYRWQNEESDMTAKVLGVSCPNCKRELKILATRKRCFFEKSYYQVIETFKGFQVIRTFQINKRLKAGTEQDFFCWKLYENWISEDGQVETVGLFLTSRWFEIWGGSYELRNRNSVTQYDINLNEKNVYPKKKVLPIIKRNGFKTSFHKVDPRTFCEQIIKNPKAETLLKAKQYDLLRKIDTQSIFMYWPSIKICIRNNYKIKDSSIWIDYLELLRYFNKDLRNKKFVCPENLLKEHDRLMLKKRNKQRRIKLQLQREQAKKNESAFYLSKKDFLSLKFQDGKLIIRPLQTVQEFMDEGDLLNHCIFTNEYYKQDNLLILSARVEGKRIATISIDLRSFKVTQVRGKNNNTTDYDDKIRKILEDNMFKIGEIVNASEKNNIAS